MSSIEYINEIVRSDLDAEFIESASNRLLKKRFVFGFDCWHIYFVVLAAARQVFGGVAGSAERVERATWSRSDSRQTDAANNLGSRMRL